MVSRDHLVTLAREGSQQNRRPQSTPLLFGSRLAEGLQLTPFRFGKLQGIALPREGHTLLKHNLVRMYCYLKNDDLDNLAEIFREVRRVLRDDGTLWLNIGDSY